MTTIITEPMREGVILADLSIKDAAERLGVSTRTLIRLVQLKYFPNAYKLNPFAKRRSEWRIPEGDIEAFIKARENKKPD